MEAPQLGKVAVVNKYCSSSNFAHIVYVLSVFTYAIKVISKYIISYMY